MQKTRTWLIAGAAAIALAGTAAFAASRTIHDSHTIVRELALQLPDGAVERVDYTGNIAPGFLVAPTAAQPFAAPYADPFAFPAAFWGAPSFAQFDRISAMMDEQMHAMLAQAAELQTALAATPAALGHLPRGTVGYSQISVWSNGHLCTKTTEMRAAGAGAGPQMISHVSGSCDDHVQSTDSGQAGLYQAKINSAPASAPMHHI